MIQTDFSSDTAIRSGVNPFNDIATPRPDRTGLIQAPLTQLGRTRARARKCPPLDSAGPAPSLRPAKRHVQNHQIHRHRRTGHHRRGSCHPILYEWRTARGRTTPGVDATIIHEFRAARWRPSPSLFRRNQSDCSVASRESLATVQFGILWIIFNRTRLTC